jgi:hypothetical protein
MNEEEYRQEYVDANKEFGDLVEEMSSSIRRLVKASAVGGPKMFTQNIELIRMAIAAFDATLSLVATATLKEYVPEVEQIIEKVARENGVDPKKVEVNIETLPSLVVSEETEKESKEAEEEDEGDELVSKVRFS